jgi:hypothetical protein
LPKQEFAYTYAMRPATAFLLLLAVLLCPTLPAATSPAGQKQPVLVELFTSEGCSDCPPADLLLKKLAEEQPLDNIEIIPLEEHVDYWNRQGWFDPFSSADFTARQNDYAGYIPKSSVYTPQMVVDGHFQLIGSRVHEALDDIRQSASQPKARLILTPAAGAKPRTRSFELTLDPDSAAALNGSSLDLYVAVTEKGLHSQPNAGENAGTALVHSPVVRQLHKLHAVHTPVTAPIPVTVNVKDEWNAANLTAVAFLVQPKTHQVQAAGATAIPAQ